MTRQQILWRLRELLEEGDCVTADSAKIIAHMLVLGCQREHVINLLMAWGEARE